MGVPEKDIFESNFRLLQRGVAYTDAAPARTIMKLLCDFKHLVSWHAGTGFRIGAIFLDTRLWTSVIFWFSGKVCDTFKMCEKGENNNGKC